MIKRVARWSLDTVQSIGYGRRAGLLVGLMLYGFEGIQSIVLIPFYKAMLGASHASTWVTISTCLALVNLAYSGYYQPLIRNMSMALEDTKSGRYPDRFRQALQRVSWQGAGTLILSQLIFCVVLFYRGALSWSLAVLPALIYFVAMQIRLQAFNGFILLNGLRRVGQDKVILLTASALNLCLQLALGWIFRDMVALALGILAANVFLYLRSRQAVGARQAQANIAAPRFREVGAREFLGLLVLNIGGYLNLGTDVYLSALLLSPDHMLDYAFWSRILGVPLALTGLWAQVNFPYWATGIMSSKDLVQNVKSLASRLVGLGAMAAGLVAGASFLGWARPLHSQPPLIFLAMLANCILTCATILLGQMLTARRHYTFVRPSFVLAGSAPFLAYALSKNVQPSAFVFGYLAINALLFMVHVYATGQLFSAAEMAVVGSD